MLLGFFYKISLIQAIFSDKLHRPEFVNTKKVDIVFGTPW